MRRIISWAAGAALLGTLASSPGWAQQGQASLSGTVKDSSGAALPGVSITAVNTTRGSSATAQVDEKGAYALTGLAEGSYRVTARLPGFSDLGRSLNLTAGKASTQDFVLTLGSMSEQITVTAARGDRSANEIPQIVTLVTGEDLDTRRPQGVQDAIERAPSMRNADPNPYRTRPQFRGLQGSRVLIVVDGERLNNSRFGADFGGISPSLVDPSQIKSIEVVGGSASSLYGSDSIAGTVNIITKGPELTADGKRFDLRGDVDGGTGNDFKRGVLALGVSSVKWGVRGSFSAFDYGNFQSGGDPVTKADTLRLGNFAVQAGLAAGRTNIANQYTIYDIPANYKIPNSGGRGKTANLEFRYAPSPKQDLRVRYVNNQYRDLGIPTGAPPLDITNRAADFQNYDKEALRYEVKDAASWLPRISVGLYRQYYERSQNDTQFAIGGSFATAIGAGGVAVSVLNGNVSTFTKSSKTDTEDHNKTIGGDIQFNVLPFKNSQFTTGINYSLDQYDGQVTQTSFGAGEALLSKVTGAANVPTNDYKNLAWFNQLELFPAWWIRLSGGVRIDNWKTEAKPTASFATTAGAAITAGLPVLRLTPGGLNVEGAAGAAGLIAGTSSIKSDQNVTTGNVGVTFPLKGGIAPFARYATSFREPDATSRYLIRNFGSAVISILGLPNTLLKPERGEDIELGVKVERAQWRAMGGWYQNKLTDAILTSFSSSLCVPASPPATVPTPFPPCSFSRTHSATFFQATNTAAVDIKGWEFAGEASMAAGSVGSFTPYLTVSGITAQNKTPDVDRLNIIKAIYGRSDNPIELEGSASDVPFNALPNVQGTAALRFTSRTGNWWAEYEYYFTSKITRIDPNNISSGGTTFFHLLSSYKGIKRHGVRGGVSFGKDNPVRLTASVENLTDSLYFAPQQPSFAPGRSVRVGATFNWKRLF